MSSTIFLPLSAHELECLSRQEMEIARALGEPQTPTRLCFWHGASPPPWPPPTWGGRAGAKKKTRNRQLQNVIADDYCSRALAAIFGGKKGLHEEHRGRFLASTLRRRCCHGANLQNPPNWYLVQLIFLCFLLPLKNNNNKRKSLLLLQV